MPDFRNSKPGDKVWDIIYEAGSIVSTDHSNTYPIYAEYYGEEGAVFGATYTYDGKSLRKDKCPRLYHSKPQIIEQPSETEKPGETDFRNAKVGDRVWDVLMQEWCEIINIDECREAALLVRFPREDLNVYFDFQGKCERYKFRTLFWDEVKIDPPVRPKRKKMVKKYQVLSLHENSDRYLMSVYFYATVREYTDYMSTIPEAYSHLELYEPSMIEVEE